MDYSLSGSSVHQIFQARILEWVVILFYRASSQLRDQTLVSLTAGRFFTVWATRLPEYRLSYREFSTILFWNKHFGKKKFKDTLGLAGSLCLYYEFHLHEELKHIFPVWDTDISSAVPNHLEKWFQILFCLCSLSGDLTPTLFIPFIMLMTPTFLLLDQSSLLTFDYLIDI